MKIRQLALVARELAPVEEQISGVFGLEVCYRDAGVGRYGLENALWAIGDTFLEVVAPVQEGTTAGRYLERRGGDGGYMVILQCDDIEAERAHVNSLGIRVVEKIDRPGAWGTHLHPKDVPGAILSIDAMEPPTEWQWAGPRWREHVSTDVAVSLVAAEIQAAEPAALAVRWSEVLRRPVETRDGSPTVLLDNGTYVRFVAVTDGRGEGIGGIDIAVCDPAEVERRARSAGCPVADGVVTVCGTRFRLMPAG